MTFTPSLTETFVQVGADMRIATNAVPFDTKALLEAADVNAEVDIVYVHGYYAPGDGGGSYYTRSASEPAHEGKIQSNDGTWWEIVIGNLGVNVLTMGAVGDGTTDDSVAINNALKMAVERETESIGGALVYFPKGDFLVTQNNVFNHPTVTAQFFRLTIQGAAKGEAILRFRPTTGGGAYADNVHAMFDGGDDLTSGDFKPLLVLFRDLLVYLEDDNLVSGDELWFTRINGDGGQQNFEMHDVEFRGPGSMTDGHVRTGILIIAGDVNGSEDKWMRCRIHKVSHLIKTYNPQAVDLVLFEVDAWVIYDHFLISEGGAIEARIYGGSWIWADAPDVDPQYMLQVLSPVSGGLGLGNQRLLCTGFKPEMRNPGAALVEAESAFDGVYVTFNGASFAGGGIEDDGPRDVVSLAQNKVVTFNDCIIPDAFAFNFTAPDALLGSTAYAVASGGLVTMHNCFVNGDLSAAYTKVGQLGRVVAKGCHQLGGTGESAPLLPLDFDSNAFNGGNLDPQPELKMAVGMPSYSFWNATRTYQVKLPYGARLVEVTAHRPGTGGAVSRTMTLEDGDAVVLATVVANENDGHSLTYTPSVASLSSPLFTDNERTLSLSFDDLSTGVRDGYFLVKYI